MQDSIETLVEALARFPGIGPRQARRMVYFLLRQKRSWVEELSRNMLELKGRSALCETCWRHFVPHTTEKVCSICGDASRTTTTLLLVEKDMDLETMEKSGMYHGRYFVLGGTISALEKEPERKIRSRELYQAIEQLAQLNPVSVPLEIILALSATPDGDDTAAYIMHLLSPFKESSLVTLSTLGRGLSTGSELEYADRETIKNALENRR